MERDISPPPTKRRKLTAVPSSSSNEPIGIKPQVMTGGSTRCIRIFSWNINGIQSFLPESTAPITSFFKPTVQQQKRARDDEPAADISPSRGPLQKTSTNSTLRAFLARHQWPEVLFLQELKINPSDQKTPTALLSTINTSSGSDDPKLPCTTYTLDVNRPRDKFNAKGFGGKLYGVGTILREDFASRHVASIRHAEWDLEGRVSIVELRRPPGDDDHACDKTTRCQGNGHRPKPLALLNVYAVNGTSAPYKSPESGKIVGTRHDHKLAFHSRLRDECLMLERRGFDVVVAGDLNVARGRLDGHPNLRTWPKQHSLNRADFNAKFFRDEDNRRADAYVGRQGADIGSGKSGDGDEDSFDGVDVFRALRGKTRKYTYHPRSDREWGSNCDRVDLIIFSRSLHTTGRVVDTDIFDTPQERGTSDHVPLWVAVKLAENGGTSPEHGP
ncbi:hypothetical protein VP1G_06226 [Cytospora mali]|uniref:Endonuclease/exonuclease/phosphatase domain-containing protein n=1 Tax=Cytospora mali TaxID=578113 RepID=A0A194V4W3_CYTMA|nr:hypothetical protein VP1G_06226 [Valsa mali var. pyri (nom. inval.)]